MGVRKGVVADVDQLVALRFWEADAQPAERAEFATFFAGWMADHAATHLPFVAEVVGAANDGVVGMAWLMVAERVAAPDRRFRRCGDVQSVYVLPDLRSAGIGAELMRAVLSEAEALGLEHVTVHANDRAVSFYHRAGFGNDPRWLARDLEAS